MLQITVYIGFLSIVSQNTHDSHFIATTGFVDIYNKPISIKYNSYSCIYAYL